MPQTQIPPERLQAVLASQINHPVTQIFELKERVGKGAYGSVFRAIHNKTGAVIALKIVNLDQPDDDIEDIQREVALLSDLQGAARANITSYYGCWLDGPRVWIAMDFAQGGSIRTLMKASKGGIIDEKYAVLIIREVLVALSYLHRKDIIHRDLKAANILLTAAGRIMLCDFGVSAQLVHSHSKRTTFIGTPFWMAPEVIQQSQYDTKADIWSLGITLYEMITGAPPHAKEDQMRALLIIPKANAPRLPENIGSRDVKDFVEVVLNKQPTKRPTAEELTKHKWIKGAKLQLSALLQLITQYNTWVQQGGTRISLAGNVDWEDQEDLSDSEMNPWEFDTVRGTASNHLPPEQTDDEQTPVEPTRSRPPPSLMGLFEKSMPVDDPFGPQTRRVVIPNFSADFDAPSPRVEIPDLDSGESPPQFFDSSNMQTARPDDFVRKFHEASASSSSAFREGLRQKEEEKVTNAPYRAPSLSGDLDKDLATQPRRVFNEGHGRESSPARSHRNASPANFTFPAVPANRSSPLGSSSPTTQSQTTVEPQSTSMPQTPTVPYEDNTATPLSNVAPPLLRSQSAAPYVPPDNSGFVRPPPPRPQPLRQQSTTALEPPSRTRPYRSASTSTQNEPSGSTLAVPKPSALREALNLALVPDSGLSVDMLPPSPSAISPLYRHLMNGSGGIGNGPNGTDLGSPPINGYESGEITHTRIVDEPNSFTKAREQSPPQALNDRMRGPAVRPLDYVSLGTPDAVHAGLAQTVSDLSQWLEVIEYELTGILNRPVLDSSSEVLDSYSDSTPIQADI